MLTSRAITWATDALAHDDTTVSALARHLRVGWHALWRAIKGETIARTSREGRLSNVRTLGVDEHIWRPSRHNQSDRAVTAMVDLTRDSDGRLYARLLDVVPGRSGTVYAAWLKAQSEVFIAGIEHAHWTRSAATPTRSATNCPTRSQCSMRFTSSSSAPRSSTKFVAAASKTPSATAD